MRLVFRPTQKIHLAIADQCLHRNFCHTGPRVRPLAGPRTGSGRCPPQIWFPVFEAVIQLAFIAPSLQITPSRRRPGPIVQPAWSCPMGHGRRSDQTQVFVEAWVPACAGMARKGNSRIVTMFIEANWVTASKAGKTRRGASRWSIRMDLSPNLANSPRRKHRCCRSRPCDPLPGQPRIFDGRRG